MIDYKDLAENHYQVVDIIVDKLLKTTQYRQYKEYREELIGEGTISLMKSAKDFDPGRGVKFVTYCSKRISLDVKRYVNRVLSQYISHHWHIDSIDENELPLIGEEEEKVKDDIEIDWCKYEPEREVYKSIYYRVLLNGEPQRAVAKDLNIGYSTLKVFKTRIIKELKKKLTGEQHAEM